MFFKIFFVHQVVSEEVETTTVVDQGLVVVHVLEIDQEEEVVPDLTLVAVVDLEIVTTVAVVIRKGLVTQQRDLAIQVVEVELQEVEWLEVVVVDEVDSLVIRMEQ